jgi:DNA anti-recombination protein RmuC
MVGKTEMDERLEQLDREWQRKYEELDREWRSKMEEMQHEMKEEMRREAETFARFVQLKNRAHELATMLWAAIKTIRDRNTRTEVMNEVRAGFDRLEAGDQQRRRDPGAQSAPAK